MNLKKFISGVSALTIAASAFAGMAVTANAETNELYSVSTWSETEMANWTATGTLTYDETNDRIWYNPTKPSAAYAASYTATVSDKAIVTYDVDWYFGSSTGRASNYEYIEFGNSLRFGWNNAYKVYVSTDAGTTYATDSIFDGKNSTYTKHIKVVYDSATKKLTSVIFDGKDISSLANTTISNFASGAISFGLQRGGGTSDWGYPNGIGDITISEETQDIQTADYTVNYVCGEDTVKSVTSTGAIGDEPDFSKTTVVGDDNVTYIYVSDDAEGVTIADDDSTVVNVTVRTQDTYTASITSSVDGSVIASQENVLELSGATLYHNRYIVKDGVAYKSAVPTSNSTGYNNDLTYANQTAEISYSEFAKNVVYFAEAEDIDDWNGVNDTARMSGGKGGYPDDNTAIVTLDPGKYVFYVGHRGNDGSYFTVTAGSTTVINNEAIHGYWLEKVSDEVELSEASDVVVSGTGFTNTKGIDYILIVKTGDVEVTPEVKITPSVEASQAYVNKDDENDCAVVGKINLNITGGTYVFDRTKVTCGDRQLQKVTNMNDVELSDTEVNAMNISANDVLVYVVINGTTDTSELNKVKFE